MIFYEFKKQPAPPVEKLFSIFYNETTHLFLIFSVEHFFSNPETLNEAASFSFSELQQEENSQGELSEKYAIEEVEKKWQRYWYDQKVFSAAIHENAHEKPLYILEMFPYPSGTLHMGHARNYSIGDVMARYFWAKGHPILHPMGWDACGLPAENAALAGGAHPKDWTYAHAATMRDQCQRLGFSHDWAREIFSCDPAYFQHEQKMFLDFYKAGLAYRKKSYVNWDPVDQCVLANEQVIEGKGWRSGALVEKKELEQWFLKITDFAEDLLQGLETLESWPESVKDMQKNWIGKSSGMVINFTLPSSDSSSQILKIFTTRPETLFGVTFCAIAWDHELVSQWLQDSSSSQKLFNTDLRNFIEKFKHQATASYVSEKEEKQGVFSGRYALHPISQTPLPIYVVNYVYSDYGTGAIMAVPAHDDRDAEIAMQHHLPIINVLHDDRLVHSDFLNDLEVLQAREAIMEHLEVQKKGERKILYRLKDWGIGRQRYWGVPIPMIHCAGCGIVPVPEKDLPVVLPMDVVFDGCGNPLDKHPTWKHVLCPLCQKPAQRETDTFDTFFESSWYFARFCDPVNPVQAFDPAVVASWLPVSHYIGGIEHAVLHLLYARFFTKALKRCGYWDLEEPFQALFAQGMVCHKTFSDTKGQWYFPEEVDESKLCLRNDPSTLIHIGRVEKMSKSKKNVVSVSAMAEVYGADAMRIFLLSDTPPQKDMTWSDEGIEGAWRYIRRLWSWFFQALPLLQKWKIQTLSKNDMFYPLSQADKAYFKDKRKIFHKGILDIENAIVHYGLNKAIAILYTLFHHAQSFLTSIKPVEECLPSHPSSTPISQDLLREFWNFQNEAESAATSSHEKAFSFASMATLWEMMEIFTQLLAPFAPHLAQEMSYHLGHRQAIHLRPWPKAEMPLLTQEIVEMPIQINGKVRAKITISPQAPENEIIEAILLCEKLKPHLQDSFAKDSLLPWKRMIIVPGKMISLVV